MGSQATPTPSAGPSGPFTYEEHDNLWLTTPFDPGNATIALRDHYIRYKNWEYGKGNGGLYDSDLWEQFQEDFQGWTEDHFKEVPNHRIRTLRATLRDYGVWVTKDRLLTIAKSLMITVNEPTPGEWKQDEIENHIKELGNFKSKRINHLIQSGGIPFTFGPRQGQQANEGGAIAPLSAVARDPAKETAKDITNLSRLYTDGQKYGGQNDNFDFALTIFNNYCSQLSIQDESTKSKAYSIMLKDQALDHFFTNLRNTPTPLSFDVLCNSTRNYFETPEYRRSQLNKWNSTTLRSVINDTKNAGKSTSECLQLLVTELRFLQPGLDISLRTDLFLHSKLVTACQDIKACEFACFKPSDTLSGLINDLQSSVITWEKTHPSETAAFFTDRRFHHSEPRRDSRFTPRYRPPRFPSRFPPPNVSRFNSNRDLRPPFKKRCFVCKKEGCWSTRHTDEEREASKAKFKDNFERRTRQYITKYEGEEGDEQDDDSDDDRINQFIMDYECGDDDDAESFMTTTVNQLNNLSFQHALTRTVTSQAEVDPFMYTATTRPRSPRYHSDRFYGIMVDTGASKSSTAGWGQYLAYQQAVDATASIDSNTAGAINVQFGIGSTPSIGSLTISTPVGIIEFHIVEADTPFLLCLADLDTLQAYYNNLKNVVVTPTKTVPVVRQFGHPFILWGKSFQQFITSSLTQNPCYLTSVELSRLHRRFGHPSIERLHALLERAGHDADKEEIKRLTKFCEHCQKHGKSPGRFKFRLSDESIDFNHSIYVDIMYIDSAPVLHVIDEATRFSAARFLKDISAKHTWEVLRLCWIDTYLGPPDLVVHDAGTNFTAKEFKQNAQSMAVTTKCVPVEAHWSVGIVERCHATLRRAYEIIKAELPATSKEIALQMAVKAVNDSSGPEGLVPTLLVFGAFPRMTELDSPAPSIAQRSTAIRKAMEEIAKVRAKMQVNNALNTRNGPNTHSIHDIALNSDVLVWRENNGWKGPFKLIDVAGETCKVLLPSGPTDFRSTVVKPFLLKTTIERILQIELPLVLCTDSKSLYECMVKLGTTQEKRLMVDLMCLRQSYERRMITEIKWIDGNSNPADAMTKSKACQALRDLIDTNKIDLSTIQWVEREKEISKGD